MVELSVCHLSTALIRPCEQCQHVVLTAVELPGGGIPGGGVGVERAIPMSAWFFKVSLLAFQQPPGQVVGAVAALPKHVNDHLLEEREEAGTRWQHCIVLRRSLFTIASGTEGHYGVLHEN